MSYIQSVYDLLYTISYIRCYNKTQNIQFLLYDLYTHTSNLVHTISVIMRDDPANPSFQNGDTFKGTSRNV